MRLIALADTHGYHDELVVPDGDVLVHAGDMTTRGTLDELSAVGAFLAALPHRHKLVVAGNHDWGLQRDPDAAHAALGDVTYLRDAGVTLHGPRFWGSPWQPQFFDWAFNLPRGQPLAERWALIPEDTDVLITHGPPRGYGDRCFDGRREGCDDLLARLDVVRPSLHLFGHIHEDRGHWWRDETLIVNATVAECEAPPTVLDYVDGSWRPA
ncbi:MAG: metallophosphatase domain-containing protein [Polyangiaceae bacterium]